MAFDTTHDIVPDSPTNVFAGFEPNLGANYLADYTNGNLTLTDNSTNSFGLANIRPLSGKWYAEFITTGTCVVGVWDFNNVNDNFYSGQNKNFRYYSSDGYIYNESGQTANQFSTYNSNNVIGVYLNLDTPEVYFYKDGSLLNNNAISLSSSNNWTFGADADGSSVSINFGQDPTFGGSKSPSSTYTDAKGIGKFYYDPPTGALALCTANLPDSAIDPNVDDLPEDYFKSVGYAGNESALAGTTDIGVSKDIGFQPDLIWAKARSTAYNHIIIDSLRPHSDPNSYYRLHPDLTNEEADYNDNIYITSNGFNCAARQSGVNENSQTFVAWCFRAGGSPSGSTSTTGSAKRINTSGTQDDTSCSALATAASTAGASNVITPTLMSINQKAGFSIVKYTGTGSAATVPHGLSSAPEMIIGKSLDASRSWNVYHVSTGNTGILQLDLTTAFYANSVYWQNTSPTSTVFSIGTQAEMNSAENIIAYCWHSVAGFSAFGSYTGNGEIDGPFVYTGFKPAFVMIKCSSSDQTGYASWAIYDNARDPYNQMNKVLYANKSVGEGYRGDGTSAYTDMFLDFTSNGFKHRQAAGETNGSSSPTYIYAAFAEQPFKYATAR